MLQKQYPMAISEVIQDGSSSIQTKEEEFIQRLDAEKENFVKSLANMKTDFTKIKTFKDPAAYYDYWKDAVALENQIQDSIILIEKFNMREARLNQQKQDYPDFDELKTNFHPFHELLTTAYNMVNTLKDLQNQPLLSSPQDYESIESQIHSWAMQLHRLQ